MDTPLAVHDGILAESHRAELVVGSGIDEDVVAERGYRTVWGTNEPVLATKGFKQNQHLGFGWMAPLRSPLGVEEATYKPDQPRASSGKTIKYEYPKDHRAILDAHPRTLPLLGSPDVRLFVTEGVKKGDSLVSRGEAAISLQGVYGWRGRNAAGGATVLADWEGIALNGREVYIAFDSDAASNSRIQAAEHRLARLLAARGALVQVVHLPPGPGGAKQGVDDFIVAGGTVEGLVSLAEAWEEPLARRRGRRDPSDSSFPERKQFPRTDAGNAELIAHLFGQNLRFDHKRSRWLIWRNDWWHEDRVEFVHQMAKEAARWRYNEAVHIADLKERTAESAWAVHSENRPRIDSALFLARSEQVVADDGEGWDRDRFLLGVLNGVVDLKTGNLRTARREDKVTRRAPVEFDATATCPTFETFLVRVQPREEMRSYLQRRSGYALTGSVAEQDLLFFHGAGSNGKTTFANALMDVLGQDYSLQAAPGLLLHKRSEAHPTELADLDGARLVVSSEVDDGRALAEGLIKQLTGGDRMKARKMRRDFYEFEASFKIVLLANHKPVIRGTDWAIWRRIKLIPFEATISAEEKDPDLRDKLKSEAPGILNWMLAGCLAWLSAGMREPDSVGEATDEYRVESDPLATFLAESCVVAPHCEASSTQLHTAYLAWCASHGMRDRERLSMTAFGRRMKEKFSREERRTGNFYIGVGVRDQHNESQPVEGSQVGFESGVEGSDPDRNDQEFPRDREVQSDNRPQPSTPSTDSAEGIREWEEAFV